MVHRPGGGSGSVSISGPVIAIGNDRADQSTGEVVLYERDQ